MARPEPQLFVPKNPQRYAGKLAQIVARSSWELDAMKRLDTSDGVITWSSEEVKISYVCQTDKEYHTYYPDFWVQQMGKNGPENVLIEVKPFKEIVKPVRGPTQSNKSYEDACKTWIKNLSKWQAAMKWCESHNSRFMILTRDATNKYSKNFHVLTEKNIIGMIKETLNG
jgi:TnsA endonuclease-like protein